MNATIISNETDYAELQTVSACVLIAFCLLSLAANCYILLAISWLHLGQKSPTIAFTISLTAADAWVSFTMAVGFTLSSVPVVAQMNHANCVLLVIEGVRIGAMVTSKLHLLLLTINQFVGVVRPLHYNFFVTPEITTGSIIALWILPTSSLMLYFSVVPNQAFRSAGCENIMFYGKQTFRIILTCCLLVPLFAMAVIYIYVFRIAWQSPVLVGRQQQQNVHRKQKSLVTTFLILGTFIIGWMPSFLRFVLVCTDCYIEYASVAQSPAWIVSGLLVQLLIILKCIVDPAVYAVRISEVKLGLQVMHDTCFGMKRIPGLDRAATIKLSFNRACSYDNKKAEFVRYSLVRTAAMVTPQATSYAVPPAVVDGIEQPQSPVQCIVDKLLAKPTSKTSISHVPCVITTKFSGENSRCHVAAGAAVAADAACQPAADGHANDVPTTKLSPCRRTESFANSCAAFATKGPTAHSIKINRETVM